MRLPKYLYLFLLLSLFSSTTFSEDSSETEELGKAIKQMRELYEQRITELESKVEKQNVQYTSMESQINKEGSPSSQKTSDKTINPALSIILDGQFSSYKNAPEKYELPGFSLGGEAGLVEDGFTTGHVEVTASANIDDEFYGLMTLAFAEHEGQTETELEEAYFETLGLGAGFSMRGGRFFPSVGYINQQHNHAWNFADAPLVYRGLWGDKYIDDGMRVAWVAPTDLYLELGVEALAGGRFPAGGESSSGSGSQVYFASLGGDLNESHSWQAGVSHYTAEVKGRQSGGHSHGGGADEVPTFTGDGDVNGFHFIYKWAPHGNYKNRHFKLQGEYFLRDEEGSVELVGSSPLEVTSYRGDQKGYYIQGVYQFMPQWQTGVRYDWLTSDNEGSDLDLLEEAGLTDEGVKPKRWSAVLEWLPSEFSRVRFQYNRDESYENSDDQILLQYTMSLGAHGAHQY